MRIVIIGGPRTGKTTAARLLSPAARSTDDVIGLGWSEASAEVAGWLSLPGPWVIEGVAAVRALRKWLEHNPGRPCDKVIGLWAPLTERTPKQDAMAKGVRSIFREIGDELIARRVDVLEAE